MVKDVAERVELDKPIVDVELGAAEGNNVTLDKPMLDGNTCALGTIYNSGFASSHDHRPIRESSIGIDVDKSRVTAPDAIG
jgi:hypothetical protein